MKSKERQEIAKIFLDGLGVAILSVGPKARTEMEKAVEKAYQEFIKGQPKDVVQETLKIKNIFEILAKKLIECDDPNMIHTVSKFVEAINTSNVMIVAPDQEIIEVQP